MCSNDPGKTEQKDGSQMLLRLITLCIYLLVLLSDADGSCPGSVYIILSSDFTKKNSVIDIVFLNHFSTSCKVSVYKSPNVLV